MASTRINSIDLGPIWLQSGNGIPDHLAYLGTQYTDLNNALIYSNIDGFNTWSALATTSVIPYDKYITGMTFSNSSYNLTLNRNDGVNFTQNLAILASDMTITGGTYNINTGVVTFTNNSGGTFSVTGFTSGMTDSFTTGATLNGNTIEFDSNLHGLNYYNVDLSPLLNPKFDKSGGTVSGGITANTISATTYQNLPLDIRVTGGTYSSGTTVFTNNTGGTFSISGYSLGDMTKAVYDTDNTGIVDKANALVVPVFLQESVNIGDPIYISSTGTPAFVKRSRQDTPSTLPAVGMMMESGTGGQTKFATLLGPVKGLNTGAFPVNTVVYVGPTGGFTGTKPATNAQAVGVVLRSGGSDGVIGVSPDLLMNEYEIYVTGGTYTAGTATFTNNTGGTFSVNGFYTGLTGSVTGSGVSGQVSYWNGTNSQTGSPNLTWDNSNLNIGTNNGLILSTSGTNRSIRIGGYTFVDNLAGASVFPSSGTNVGTSLTLIPKGTGYSSTIKSQISILNTDLVADSVNYEHMSVRAGGTAFVLTTGRVGTGVLRPLLLSAGYGDSTTNPNQLWLYTDGRVGINNAVNNATDHLQVNGSILGTSIKRSGGTATQFLKADGSVDSNTYVTSARTLNINGVTQDLSANRQWRAGLSNTGVLTYGGISLSSSTSVNIGAVNGIITDNETNPAIPTYSLVTYSGGTNITVPTIGSGTGTYVLLNASGSLVFQNTFPTSAQRKSMIYLSKISHPNLTSISFVIDEVDFVTSPLQQFRDLFQVIQYMHMGIVAIGNSGLTINTTNGLILGDGINFVADRTNPNTISIPAGSPRNFLLLNQSGASGGFVTAIDPTTYDVGGVTTTIPGGNNRCTIQYLYYAPGVGFAIQRGQTWYPNITDAVAAVGREPFVVRPNLVNNSILISAICLRKGASNLNDTGDAIILPADKFGQIGGAAAGISVTNLQTAYNNSITPEITTNATSGALSIINGTGNPDSTTSLFEGMGTGGTVTSKVMASGSYSGTSFVKSGGTEYQTLMADGSVFDLLKNQVEYSGNQTVQLSWNGKEVTCMSGGTLTIPNTLPDQFSFDLASDGAIITWAITSPYTWRVAGLTVGVAPPTMVDGQFCTVSKRIGTNEIRVRGI